MADMRSPREGGSFAVGRIYADYRADLDAGVAYGRGFEDRLGAAMRDLRRGKLGFAFHVVACVLREGRASGLHEHDGKHDPSPSAASRAVHRAIRWIRR
jgi:hypothetical protein